MRTRAPLAAGRGRGRHPGGPVLRGDGQPQRPDHRRRPRGVDRAASSSGACERLDQVGWAAARVGLPLCLLILMRRDSVLWGALLVAAPRGPHPVGPTPPPRYGSGPCGRGASPPWPAPRCPLAMSGPDDRQHPGRSGPGGSFWDAVGDANFIARGADRRHPRLVRRGAAVPRLPDLPREHRVPGGGRHRVRQSPGQPDPAGHDGGGHHRHLAIGTIRWPYVQGRYLLPLTVGLPIVAGLGLVEALGRVPSAAAAAVAAVPHPRVRPGVLLRPGPAALRVGGDAGLVVLLLPPMATRGRQPHRGGGALRGRGHRPSSPGGTSWRRARGRSESMVEPRGRPGRAAGATVRRHVSSSSFAV